MIASSFLSVRAAHLAAARDRALITLDTRARSTSLRPHLVASPLECQMAHDILWMLDEVQRLDELVTSCGLALDYGQSQ